MCPLGLLKLSFQLKANGQHWEVRAFEDDWTNLLSIAFKLHQSGFLLSQVILLSVKAAYWRAA